LRELVYALVRQTQQAAPHRARSSFRFARRGRRVEPRGLPYCRDAIRLPHHALLGSERWVVEIILAWRKVCESAGALKAACTR
jgi:hypothetical protein